MTRTEGEQLRIDGINTNLAAATSTHRPYRWHAETIIARFCREQRPFTAEDIRREIPAGIEPHHPNVLGSVIGNLAARNEIEAIDRTITTRRSRHSSRNCIWKRHTTTQKETP